MTKLIEALEVAFTKLRRKRISRRVFGKYNGVVQQGPFKGLKLSGNANTSSGNLGAKLFGLYEQEVLSELDKLGPFDDIVNVGAADGYFSLGTLVSGMAQRSICFEITETGRKELQNNADANKLADQVVILGAADENTHAKISKLGFNAEKGLVFCDIEGAEFDLFTDEFLNDFKGATLIIELHDRLMSEGTILREKLIGRLPDEANYTILKGQPKDWAGISDVEDMSDNDRALFCSDGRKVLGEWLIVTYC